MAQLYANENFPLAVVQALRTLGHDVLTVSEAGNAGLATPDEQVLTFATQRDRAVLTLNRRDFIRLQSLQPAHAGIIVCTQDQDTSGQAARIDEALKVNETLKGRLIRVDRPLR